MAHTKIVRMANGVEMPLVGLGTWQSKPAEVGAAVELAIDCGYQHIDTAYVYQNEKAIGEAIRKKIADGKIKRSDIFVVTKLHGYFHAKSEVKKGLQESLAHLGLDHVDLFLVHTPVSMKRVPGGALVPLIDGKLQWDVVDHLETWQGMEECYNAGMTRSIGLSNFNRKQLQRIYDAAAVKPMNLQIECHAYWPQYEMHELCKRLNITLTAYGPIGSPNLRHWMENMRKQSGADLGNIQLPLLLNDAKVNEIATKHHKTAAQVLIRWLIQRNIAAIPKSTNSARIRENIDVFDFELSNGEFDALSKLDTHHQMFHMDWARESLDYPYPL